MRRYLLDTGIAGCFIDRRRGVIERARAEVALGNWIGIAHPVLAELAYRVEGSANRDRNMQRLQLALASWRLWPVTEAAAFEYGRIPAELRRIGRPIGQNDMMIAAIYPGVYSKTTRNEIALDSTRCHFHLDPFPSSLSSSLCVWLRKRSRSS
jgi:tRNA(fMet)-specific endonuclease VapC